MADCWKPLGLADDLATPPTDYDGPRYMDVGSCRKSNVRCNIKVPQYDGWAENLHYAAKRIAAKLIPQLKHLANRVDHLTLVRLPRPSPQLRNRPVRDLIHDGTRHGLERALLFLAERA